MSHTATQLFAEYRGITVKSGAERCFFCGANCDNSLLSADCVAESFMERDLVRAPHSDFVCDGCAESMRSDIPFVEMLDGERKLPKAGSSRLIQVRWFSWIIANGKSLAATPAHRDLIAETCLNPPKPPFAICVADGNKHLLYRTPVNHNQENIAVMCEGELIYFTPQQLRERLFLMMRVISICGKGGDSITRLLDPQQNMSVAMQLNAWDDSLFSDWLAVRDEPLTSLAIWLCPGKDDCLERLASKSY